MPTTTKIRILIHWAELCLAQAKSQADKMDAEAKLEDFHFYLRIIEENKLANMPGLPKTIEKRGRQIPPEKDWQRKVPCQFYREDFLPSELDCNGCCQTCLDE